MFIYYVITMGAFGEPWTQYSYVQLLGMFVLLYGTAVYNAPNAGSVQLRGKWWDLFMDFSSEYDKIALDMHEAAIDQEWEDRKREFKTGKRLSSFAERSPMVSVHTQALRGLASSKI